jgi:hypothetical protein
MVFKAVIQKGSLRGSLSLNLHGKAEPSLCRRFDTYNMAATFVNGRVVNSGCARLCRTRDS